MRRLDIQINSDDDIDDECDGNGNPMLANSSLRPSIPAASTGSSSSYNNNKNDIRYGRLEIESPYSSNSDNNHNSNSISNNRSDGKGNRFFRIAVVYIIIILVIICVIVPSLVLFSGTTSSNGTEKTSSMSDVDWSNYQVKSSKGGALVASDNADCSTVGVNVLKQGGNAVDAAVATALCLGVISPGSSGIGGGCYIIINDNNDSGSAVFIDARETAPSGAYKDMFISDPLQAQNGAMAIAVPGELKGLYLAWKTYGKLPWKDVVTPAETLANEWRISKETEVYLNVIAPYILSGAYPQLSDLYLNSNGEIKKEGDVVKQATLSNTLHHIGIHGPDYLYVTMAGTMASEIQSAGGIVTSDDIKRYNVNATVPLVCHAFGHTIYSASGSSSGGAAVCGLLKFMSAYKEPLVSLGHLYYHRLAEAMKHVFAIKLNLGDPTYTNSTGPIDALMSDSYMSNLTSFTSDDSILKLQQYGGVYNYDYSEVIDSGTTHLSVIDANLAVAITSTINTEFGSKFISPSLGILYNNEMDDFSIPNTPNYFGLYPSPYNYPQPFKRPLSSMTPSIVYNAVTSKIKYIGGASGGPRIITATAQVLMNMLNKGMDALSAVVSPRIHTQLLPFIVDVEYQHSLIDGSVITSEDDLILFLQHKKQNVSKCSTGMGVSQFISIDPDSGEMLAVSDPRKNGRPAGL